MLRKAIRATPYEKRNQDTNQFVALRLRRLPQHHGEAQEKPTKVHYISSGYDAGKGFLDSGPRANVE